MVKRITIRIVVAREQAVRRAKATCHGQANHAQLDKVWRIQMESKFNTKHFD